MTAWSVYFNEQNKIRNIWQRCALFRNVAKHFGHHVLCVFCCLMNTLVYSTDAFTLADKDSKALYNLRIKLILPLLIFHLIWFIQFSLPQVFSSRYRYILWYSWWATLFESGQSKICDIYSSLTILLKDLPHKQFHRVHSFLSLSKTLVWKGFNNIFCVLKHVFGTMLLFLLYGDKEPVNR